MKCLQTASAITVFPEKPGQRLFAVPKTDPLYNQICESKDSLTYDEVFTLINERKDAFLEGEDFKATTSGTELKFVNDKGSLIVNQRNYLRLKHETEGLIKAERNLVLANYIELFKKIQNIDIKNPSNVEAAAIDADRNIILNNFLNNDYYTVNDDGTLYKFINIKDTCTYFRLKKGQSVPNWEIKLGAEGRRSLHKVLVQFDPETIHISHSTDKFCCTVNLIDEDPENYADGLYGAERYTTLVDCLTQRLDYDEPADNSGVLRFKSTLAQNEFIDEYMMRCKSNITNMPLAKLVSCKTFEDFLKWDKN